MTVSLPTLFGDQLETRDDTDSCGDVSVSAGTSTLVRITCSWRFVLFLCFIFIAGTRT